MNISVAPLSHLVLLTTPLFTLCILQPLFMYDPIITAKSLYKAISISLLWFAWKTLRSVAMKDDKITIYPLRTVCFNITCFFISLETLFRAIVVSLGVTDFNNVLADPYDGNLYICNIASCITVFLFYIKYSKDVEALNEARIVRPSP